MPLLYAAAQTDDSTYIPSDTLITEQPIDTLSIKDSLKKAFLNDPARLKIVELINTVNDKSASIDLLHSENVIKIKASSIDQAGDIEIKVKRNDDIWFRISGSFAMISKDAFIAHFNRKKFIYFDNLNDKVIEGPTTSDNIGYILRIKCTFDDMMNVMSGACRIVYTDSDTLKTETDKLNTIIIIKNGKKFVKYWVENNSQTVTKYAYLNAKFRETLSVSYSNFVKAGSGNYARKIEIYKPLSGEFLRVFNETYTLNNPSLDFKVTYPDDTRKVFWSK
ncbi:MAG: DUF4292 domain-containing protein [Bacteroidetes bacterium]|nr:DUF4292 domain-containing protein [Bacteroidota bacterium]